MTSFVVMDRDRRTYRFLKDTRLGRTVSLETASPSWAATMNSCQACAGRLPPVTFFIGRPSSLPNQTPVVRLDV